MSYLGDVFCDRQQATGEHSCGSEISAIQAVGPKAPKRREAEPDVADLSSEIVGLIVDTSNLGCTLTADILQSHPEIEQQCQPLPGRGGGGKVF